MQFRGQGIFTSTASEFDSTHASFPTFRVAYDLVAGTVEMYHCCSLGITSVKASDLYDVAGVPAGTPVPLIVTFTVDGEAWDAGFCGGSGCGGILASSIQNGDQFNEVVNAPTLFAGNRAQYHDVIELPVTIVAGQPERIDFKIWGTRSPGGSHGSTGMGTIRFEGLPTGASITSCQGYGGTTTPARRTSWGSIKAIYR